MVNKLNDSLVINGISYNQNNVYIIAEVGSNHGGSLETALEYVELSKKAGANAIKFQSWNATKLLNPYRYDDHGKLVPNESIGVLEKYQFHEDWYEPLINKCNQLEIDFLTTPFDLENAKFLKKLNLPAIKIASGDLTYHQLIAEVADYDIPLILSTGMASMEEITEAISILEKNHASQYALLHCVAAYPPNKLDANISAISSLKSHFKIPVGYSDHFDDNLIDIAAVSLGACIIEKHVTISKKAGHPDSSFACDFDSFKDMIDQIRTLSGSLGDGVKKCQESEKDGLTGGRRCLYAGIDIEQGEIITEENVTIVRPNIGDFQPKDLSQLIGKKVTKSIKQGSPLMKNFFEKY